MTTVNVRVKKGVSVLFLLAITGAGTPSVASAGTIGLNPLIENVEVMMDAQGANVSFIARALGIDPNARLQFSTVTDVENKSFSFSLASGTTYLGQPITLEVSGLFDTLSGLWLLSSSGQLGGTLFNGSGAGGFSSSQPAVGAFDWEWVQVPPAPPPPPLLDWHSGFVVGEFFAEGFSSGDVRFTVLGVTVFQGRVTDRVVGLLEGDVDWDYELELFPPPIPPPPIIQEVRFSSAGRISAGPGARPGFFEATITPVPEPSTITLLSISAMVLLASAWRRMRARALHA